MHNDGPTIPEPPETTLLRAGFAEDDRYDDLIRAGLAGDAVRTRVLALRAAVRRGLMSDERWRTALDDDVEVRREAATLLAQAGLDETTARRLIELLGDDDPLVVDAASFALGEGQRHEALTSLCDVAANHADARCRESAIAALGVLGDEAGLATVIAALDDKPPVRRRAVVALANFEGDEVDAALARAAQDRDWQVRAAVKQLAGEE